MIRFILRKVVSILLCAFLLSGMASCGVSKDASDPVSGDVSDAPAGTTTTDGDGAGDKQPDKQPGKSTSTTSTGTGTSTQTAQGGTTGTTQGGGSSATTTVKPTVSPSKPTNPPAKPTVKGKTKVADYVRNVGAWTMNGFAITDRDFTFQVQILGKPQYERMLLDLTISGKKLGDTGTSYGATVYAAEWSGNREVSGGSTNPKTRGEALDNVRAWLRAKIEGKSGPFSSMESFTRWQHYAAEVGYDYIGCEIGANVNAFNLSVAFTRGAAKQYNQKMGLGSVDAWFVDFSLWNWWGMINYTGDETMHRHNDGAHDNVTNHEYAGQSVSAARRAYYMAYMSGAQWLINEGGAESACYPTVDKEGDWLYNLSPHGEMNQEFYDFTQRNPDRGITYTPFAVVLNHDHGLPSGHWKVDHGDYNVFEWFPFTEGDWMIDRLFRMLYPDNYPYQNIRDDGKQQVNTPYGDTMDVLTHTADLAVLNSYPVVLLAGDIPFTGADVARYTAYVEQGGTLLLNTAYKKYFPAFNVSKSYGKGRVFVYGGDYKVDQLPSLLNRLLRELIPFTFSEDVQYIMNVKDGSLVLTLINNNGTFKAYDKAMTVDPKQSMNLKVTYTGGNKVLEVRDWISGEKRTAAKSQEVYLAPGEVAVLEFVV